jgi:hypothetical protein
MKILINRLLLCGVILSGFQSIFSMDNDIEVFERLVSHKPIARVASFIAEDPKRASMLLEKTDLDGRTKTFIAETIKKDGQYDPSYIVRGIEKRIVSGMDTKMYPDVRVKVGTTPLSKLLIYSAHAKHISGTTRIAQESAFLLNERDQATAYGLVQDFRKENTRQIDVELQRYHNTKELSDEIVQNFTTKSNNEDLYLTVPRKSLAALTQTASCALGWGFVGALIGSAVPVVGNGVQKNITQVIDTTIIDTANSMTPLAKEAVTNYAKSAFADRETLHAIAMDNVGKAQADGPLEEWEFAGFGLKIGRDYASEVTEHLQDEPRAIRAIVPQLKAPAFAAGMSAFSSAITSAPWFVASTYTQGLNTADVYNASAEGFKWGFIAGGLYGISQLNKPIIPPTAIRLIKKPNGRDNPKNSPLFLDNHKQ